MKDREIKPRYTVANIVTTDVTMVEAASYIRSKGWTHESIYRRGLEEIEKEINAIDKPNG